MSEPIVLWCGRFSKSDGYGTVARNHLRGLELAGARHAGLDLDTLRLVGARADPGLELTGGSTVTVRTKDRADRVVVVFHERPDQYPRVRVDGRARLVGHSVFETEGLPPRWAEWMTSVDEVWAATEFNRRTFAASGVPEFMITKVPHSIDTELYAAANGTTRLGSEGEVVFLTVCSGLQRRDLGLAFRSFLRTFTADSPVRYVVKLRDDATMLHAARALLERAVATVGGDAAAVAGKVDLRPLDLGPEEMARLYRSGDVYVSVERANGWDLPTIESMAAGKPTIGFHTGGSTEYTDDDVAIRLPVGDASVPVEQHEPHPFYTAQWWPVVDESLMDDAFARVMDPDLRARIGAAAAAHVRAHFDVRVVGARIRELVAAYEMVDLKGNERAEVTIGHDPVWRSPAGPRLPLVERVVVNARRRARRGARRARQRAGPSSTVGVPAVPAEPLGRRLERSARTVYRGARDVGRRLDLKTTAEVAAAVREIRGAPYDPTRSWTDADLAGRRRAFGRHPLIPLRDEDRDALAAWRDRYAGERIFVIGNGPSLNRTDLSKLAHEYTFGVNKIYLLYDRIDWRPSFYTLLDWRVGPEIAPEVERLSDSVKFLPNRFRGLFPDDDTTLWYTTRPVLDHLDDQFRVDIVDGVPSKGTILVTAIQLATFLGFRDIVLIGVDASYTIPPTVKQSGPDRFGTGVRLNLESTADDDPNHFDPSYFGKGARWHDPNVDEMVRQFRQMRKGVEFHGGRIRNATVGGNLEVFERVDFDDLF